MYLWTSYSSNFQDFFRFHFINHSNCNKFLIIQTNFKDSFRILLGWESYIFLKKYFFLGFWAFQWFCIFCTFGIMNVCISPNCSICFSRRFKNYFSIDLKLLPKFKIFLEFWYFLKFFIIFFLYIIRLLVLFWIWSIFQSTFCTSFLRCLNHTTFLVLFSIFGIFLPILYFLS